MSSTNLLPKHSSLSRSLGWPQGLDQADVRTSLLAPEENDLESGRAEESSSSSCFSASKIYHAAQELTSAVIKTTNAFIFTDIPFRSGRFSEASLAPFGPVFKFLGGAETVRLGFVATNCISDISKASSTSEKISSVGKALWDAAAIVAVDVAIFMATAPTNTKIFSVVLPHNTITGAYYTYKNISEGKYLLAASTASLALFGICGFFAIDSTEAFSSSSSYEGGIFGKEMHPFQTTMSVLAGIFVSASAILGAADVYYNRNAA